MACLVPLAASAQAIAEGCAPPPHSSFVVNVKDTGAKGDGKTDDSTAIQAAIDKVGGTGGTVLVPDGIYLIDAVSHPLSLKSDMTFKLSQGATLKTIPNAASHYFVLLIQGVSKVNVVGGTVLGDRKNHNGKSGAGGMGISVGSGASQIVISSMTSSEMWGDGFYVEDASDVRFCAVTADYNRRQGLSIIEADGVLVTHSVFRNTQGTMPSDGIDLEPDKPQQTITNVRIEYSKFLNNAGNGIEIAGKRGKVSNVTIHNNVFTGGRPILVENAPSVRSTAICQNRYIGPEKAPTSAFTAFAEPASVVALQSDCRRGRDLRFEWKRNTKKKKHELPN